MPCGTWNTANCKASEAGGKKPTLISQVHFCIWQGKQLRLQALLGHSPTHRGLSQEPPENQTHPEVLEGRCGRRCEFLHSSSPLHTTYTNSVVKPAHTFLRYAPLLFSLFILTHLCFLLLAGPGSGNAEKQEWIQPHSWLRYESPCSSDFAAAFQISVPKKVQILI